MQVEYFHNMRSANQSQRKIVLLVSFAVCDFYHEFKSALISVRIHNYTTISAAQADSLSSALYLLKTKIF